MSGISDAFWISVIRCLRRIPLAAPSARGLWRVDDWVNRAAARVRGGATLQVDSVDGRRFAVDVRERQYRMGLLGLGIFEPAETRVVSAVVRPGAVVLDVGANYGWYTTLLSRLVGAEGRVHAFEPVPANFAALTRNCELNACANVVINECAVGAAAGETVLHYFPGDACGNATMYKERARASVPFRCRVTTLDDHCEGARVARCDFIKCDVEGAELEVLRGAARTLARDAPTILVELNPPSLARAGTTPAGVLEEIGRHGDYSFHRVDERGTSRIERAADCDVLESYVNVLCVSARRSGDLERAAAL